ncbi:MAG: response regulator [Planctomycetales bacterium]|nr:response regulator [Planctomycetales bacterium]
MTRALAQLRSGEFSSVLVAAGHITEAFRLGTLFENERILESLPIGVAVLDSDNTIIWGNARLRGWCSAALVDTTNRGGADAATSSNGGPALDGPAFDGAVSGVSSAGGGDRASKANAPGAVDLDAIIGRGFYEALGSPEILGPDFCPFHTALATGSATTSTLRSHENRYFQVHATAMQEEGDGAQHLIVTVRDITTEILQQQKLAAIHQAGIELSDLSPEELLNMTVEERIELLKSNIVHYTQDLLHFDVVEIRLLDPATDRLDPLLALGIEPEAARRDLYARPNGNGVTGFVAAAGKSYLCEDTSEDPLYLEGARGAKSSLTVPLILHDEVIGTFNVESPKPSAFSESDLQFLEIFSREVAVALNTLELLSVEKAGTAAESVEAIHSAVALPVDDILIDAVNIMEHYVGHEPEVVQRLQRLLRNARDIKQLIQRVGRSMAPSQAIPRSAGATEERALLVGRNVLMVDADDDVRSAAHGYLERYGCVVETAHNGDEALCMVRNMMVGGDYDAIISDIRLPDMSGFELMMKLKEIIEVPPLILMTGFGYDPGHSIVKARQAGLQAELYKPFRLDQLLETVERVILLGQNAKAGK